MIGWMLLALVVTLAAFPRRLGAIRARLVDWVEAAIHEMTPMRLVFWIVVIVAAAALGQILAADLAWLAALDVATYLEVMAAITLAGAAVRIGVASKAAATVMVRVARALMRPVRRAACVVRVQMRRVSKAPPPDEDAGALALAALA